MKLLQPHEWEYLRNTAINKTEAVCWPDRWMIHPDREELFVTRRKDMNFLVTPNTVKMNTEHRRHYFEWAHEDSVNSFMFSELAELFNV